MARRKLIAAGFGVFLAAVMLLPEQPVVPVAGAGLANWNRATFWYEPWGESAVHKGINIFAMKGTPVTAPTWGLVLFRGEIRLGGRVIFMLGPKLRLHYFAHLDGIDVYPGYPVAKGRRLGSVGATGNARGKPSHLHYSVLTLLPYPWLADDSTQGWKKMIYLDPFKVLGIK